MRLGHPLAVTNCFIIIRVQLIVSKMTSLIAVFLAGITYHFQLLLQFLFHVSDDSCLMLTCRH